MYENLLPGRLGNGLAGQLRQHRFAHRQRTAPLDKSHLLLDLHVQQAADPGGGNCLLRHAATRGWGKEGKDQGERQEDEKGQSQFFDCFHPKIASTTGVLACGDMVFS